jgi:hypothetical protein
MSRLTKTRILLDSRWSTTIYHHSEPTFTQWSHLVLSVMITSTFRDSKKKSLWCTRTVTKKQRNKNLELKILNLSTFALPLCETLEAFSVHSSPQNRTALNIFPIFQPLKNVEVRILRRFWDARKLSWKEKLLSLRKGKKIPRNQTNLRTEMNNE